MAKEERSTCGTRFNIYMTPDVTNTNCKGKNMIYPTIRNSRTVNGSDQKNNTIFKKNKFIIKVGNCK